MRFSALLILGILIVSCFAQQKSAEELFIEARGYSFQGNDSMALKVYEEAYKLDSSSYALKREVLIRYLRTDQFKKAAIVIESIKDRNLSLVSLDQYSDGNKVAEFYCFYGDTVGACELWQRLIGVALKFHHVDSAIVLANSFAKNMPSYDLPKKIQTALIVLSQGALFQSNLFR
jgi:hypothetical protein